MANHTVRALGFILCLLTTVVAAWSGATDTRASGAWTSEAAGPGAATTKGLAAPDGLAAEWGESPVAVRFAAAGRDDTGWELTVLLAGDHARLLLPDRWEVTLPRVGSRRGRRYSDGAYTLTVRGTRAILVMPGDRYRLRVVQWATDPWERARLWGAEFRGIGQEPGWVVEIRADGRVELLLDYGDTRITTPIAPAEASSDGDLVTYRTPRDWAPLDITITIRAELCYDGMSGEEFPASVVVRLAGSAREYHGCGRWLQ